MEDFGGTPNVWSIISFISRREGTSSKELSKDRIGREPLRQFPDRLSSSAVCTIISPVSR